MRTFGTVANIWCILYLLQFKCSIYIIIFHIYILGSLFWILPCMCKQKNLYRNIFEVIDAGFTMET